jgi:galactokinase
MTTGQGSELPAGHWGRFVFGAVGVLADVGIEIGGVDLLLAGDIPGSGLSSSASLAVGLLYALSECAGQPLAPLALAMLAQRVEHRYIGVQCGLMDQAVIALAQPECALWFDCADHRHRAIALAPDAPAVVVINTALERKLVHSAYNERLAETRTAAQQLGVVHAALARLDPRAWRERAHLIVDATVLRRARHVVAEGARVAQAVEAMERGDWPAVGALFNASHASLRDDFAVSCAHLDALAALCCDSKGCFGARMTGAGFGGSVVALVDRPCVASLTERVTAAYQARFEVNPPWFIARSRGGMREIDG